MQVKENRLLVVTQNPHFLKDSFAKLNIEFLVQQANSESMSHFLCEEWRPKVCLIDLDGNWPNLLQSLRVKYPYGQLGIIAITKNTSPQMEDFCFKSGADYVLGAEPHTLSLMARIRTLNIRSQQLRGPVETPNEGGLAKSLMFGPLEVFPNDFLVKNGDKIVNPTPTQFRLLITFLSSQDKLLSRERLREQVWEGSEISPRSIDAQISKLKKLLPSLDPYLVNVYGKGYILTKPKSQVA